MILKESSLIREAENKMKQQQGGGFQAFQQQQVVHQQPGLLGPPPPLEPPPTTRSPHKNDLPMADQGLLQDIEADPTKALNIDDVPRTIRYFGETATIVMEDNRICELSFQAEMEARRI